MDIDMKATPVLGAIAAAHPVCWINPGLMAGEDAFTGVTLNTDDILDAESRLKRFAPFIARCFPETRDAGGIIESPLTEIPNMRELLNLRHDAALAGALYLKRDSDLPIAGSVKARGGIYEILKRTEELAFENGLLPLLPGEDYSVLADERCRKVFSRYSVQVASTGNLGLSIGITSAVTGYNVTVHMSADAREWKKKLLREKGVNVVEYAADYSEAVRRGRALSDKDPMSYFVDDENSVPLFMGYAVATLRLREQLERAGVTVDQSHPLFVYIPCGVGGAPGGVTFGLKKVYGDNVHVFFAEPVQAPCMTLGMATGLNGRICVQDVGLHGHTHADGLAVGRPSGFVGGVMKHMLSGSFTLTDDLLFDHMRELVETEDIFIEPSSCAAFAGPVGMAQHDAAREYVRAHGLEGVMNNATHIVWATGGRLVPENIRKEYMETRL